MTSTGTMPAARPETGAGDRRTFSGGRRRRLVQHREPVPGNRPGLGRGLAPEVPGLSQRMATGAFPVVERLPAASQRPRRLGAAVRPAERVDEALSHAGDAPYRAVHPLVVARPPGRSAARAGDVVPHYIYLRDQLQPDVSIYYNIDDYCAVLASTGASGAGPRACAGAIVGRDGVRLLAADRGIARRCRKHPAGFTISRTVSRRRSWRRARSRSRPSRPRHRTPAPILAFSRALGAAATNIAEAAVPSSTPNSAREPNGRGRRAGPGPGGGGGDAGIHQRARRVSRLLLAQFDRASRRAAAARGWSEPGAGAGVADGPGEVVALGFVDLVGSTSWAEGLSLRDQSLALSRFESAAWSSAVRAGGRVVKMIGDEVFFAAPRRTPPAASASRCAGRPPWTHCCPRVEGPWAWAW